MAWFDPGRTRLKGPAALTWVVMLGAMGMLNAQPPIPPGTWLGQGASDTEPFGGSPYCNFTVTMQNVQLSFTVSPGGTVTYVSASATMIESAPGCPYPTIPTNNHSFTGTGSISGNTVTLQFTGAASNNPQDVGYFTGTLNGSGQIQGTVLFTRTDLGPPNQWTTHHAVAAGIGAAPPAPYSESSTGSTGLGMNNDATTGPSQCTSGDPVNCANGNLIESNTDLSVAQGRGRLLRLVRTYNGLDAAANPSPGPLGYGWTHSYAAY